MKDEERKEDGDPREKKEEEDDEEDDEYDYDEEDDEFSEESSSYFEGEYEGGETEEDYPSDRDESEDYSEGGSEKERKGKVLFVPSLAHLREKDWKNDQEREIMTQESMERRKKSARGEGDSARGRRLAR